MKVPGQSWIVLLFSICLVFFLYRGPYRAIRFSTTGDFSTVYAAARCWISGENPYDRHALKAELLKAGAPLHLERNQDLNPSVYLPAAMPWAAMIAWMPWGPANLGWCLASLLVFGVSIWLILSSTQLPLSGKWLGACAALLFSPTYVGIYDGNPSVIAIGLITTSICLSLEGSLLASGVWTGVAMCFKPQIAFCALCIFVLWRRWKAVSTSLTLFLLATVIGVSKVSGFGRTWSWWQTEQQNVAISFQPGGQSDPSTHSAVAWQLLNSQTLAAYVFQDRLACDLAVWILSAALVILFLILRKSPAHTVWQDVGFFATLTLTVTYHRYYDAQILLLLLPLLAFLWQRGERSVPALLVACLALLAFPLQSVFARKLGAAATVESLVQMTLLRNQPLAVLTLTTLLAFSGRFAKQMGESH